MALPLVSASMLDSVARCCRPEFPEFASQKNVEFSDPSQEMAWL